jgi:hypothetical protein
LNVVDAEVAVVASVTEVVPVVAAVEASVVVTEVDGVVSVAVEVRY